MSFIIGEGQNLLVPESVCAEMRSERCAISLLISAHTLSGTSKFWPSPMIKDIYNFTWLGFPAIKCNNLVTRENGISKDGTTDSFSRYE
jgi:hypothetical protein